MQTQEKAVEASKSFLEASAEALSSLLGQRPVSPTEDVQDILSILGNAARAVHAYRTWPVFDPACLSMMRDDGRAKLFVPVFAFSDLMLSDAGRGMRHVWAPASDTALFHEGLGGSARITVRYPEPQMERNRASLRASEGGRPWAAPSPDYSLSRLPFAREAPEGIDRTRLTAVPPNVPDSVRRRAAAAAPLFDAMKLVWEAEWTGEPVKDPFVIGVLRGKCFLVDQYDATKLERYIISEMCRSPRGGTA